MGGSWCLRAEVGAYGQNLAITGGSWCLWAIFDAYWQNLALTDESWCLWAEFGACRRKLVLVGRSWRLWAEVGVFKFWKFSKSKKLGQNFKIPKKLGQNFKISKKLGQDFEKPKSWGIRVGARFWKVGAPKKKVGKKKHFGYTQTTKEILHKTVSNRTDTIFFRKLQKKLVSEKKKYVRIRRT